MDKTSYADTLIKPCKWYLEEHMICSKFYNKFYEYYTEGKKPNCKEWHIDYQNCVA